MLGSLATLIAGVAVVVRYVPVTNHLVLVAVVAAPYLLLAGPAGAMLFALVRRWILAGIALLLTACAIAVQLPLFIASPAGARGIAIRVMTANVYLGQTDATSLTQTAVGEADVLSVQELTPAQVDRLHAAGLDSTFPFRMLDAQDGANGGGVWSRYPIVSTHTFPGYRLAVVGVRIRVPGIAVDPTVVVAHMSGPWPQPIDGWIDDLARMHSTMRQVAAVADGGCVVIAGDFNSTLDMASFRALLSDGYRDGAEQAGAGLTPTYPGNRPRIPAFMAIDHVLTSHCTATALHAVELPGSDHRGLVAAVAIRARG